MVSEEGNIVAIGLRLVLLAGAVFILAFVLLKIRRAQLQTTDAVFWFLFAGCLVLLAIFPQIVYHLAGFIGVESPANLVFLLILGILIIRLLNITVETARLKQKLDRTVQHIALQEADGSVGKDDEN